MKAIAILVVLAFGCGGVAVDGAEPTVADAAAEAAADECSARPATWEPYCSAPARPFVLTGCADAGTVHVDGKVCRYQANVLAEWFCCVAE